jgi:hypothetical protein
VTAEQGVELGDLSDVLELVERDERAEAPGLLESQREVEQRMECGQRVGARLELKLGADAERAQREAKTGPLENSSTLLRMAPLSCLE